MLTTLFRFGQHQLLLSLALFHPCAASAEGVVLRTSDHPIDGTTWNQGWWSDTAPNSSTHNVSTLIGNVNGDHRAFFTFFLPPTLGEKPIVSAMLVQPRGLSSPNNETDETIAFYRIDTPANVLNDNVGLNVAIYNDLGTGTNYGEFVVPGTGPSAAVFEVPLNAAALNDMAANGAGYFSIGGALLSNDGDDYLLVLEIARATELHLFLIPEPNSQVLLTVLCLVGSVMYPSRCRVQTQGIACEFRMRPSRMQTR